MAGCSNAQRFASLEKEEIDAILENADAKNCKRQTNTAVKIFRQYLSDKNIPVEFEAYSEKQLYNALSKFYLEMSKWMDSCIKNQPCNPTDRAYNATLVNILIRK